PRHRVAVFPGERRTPTPPPRPARWAFRRPDRCEPAPTPPPGPGGGQPASDPPPPRPPPRPIGHSRPSPPPPRPPPPPPTTRPGANVTGLSTIGSDLSGKRLELLKEALPGAERVAVLWNRPSEGSLLAFRELELASGQVGVSLQDIGVSDPVELRDAVESAVR